MKKSTKKKTHKRPLKTTNHHKNVGSAVGSTVGAGVGVGVGAGVQPKALITKGAGGAGTASIPMISGKGRQQQVQKRTDRAAAKAARQDAKPIRIKKAREGMSGLDAAARVLNDAAKPLNAIEMVKAMLAEGLWKTGGKTPQATIYAAIIRDIGTKGSASRFRKAGRGHFTVTAHAKAVK